MASTIRDVMAHEVQTVQANDAVADAARLMRDNDIGDVIVLDDNGICGIVTDRDITVRVVAEGRDSSQTTVSEVCSADPRTVSPDDEVHRAVEIMREAGIRRLPVVEGDRPVGVVSIGDLAIEVDEDSALADISAQRGNT